ncbi:MAG: hypothetical protein ABIS03_05880 [Gemmatimonadaceae bacterium]
MQSSSNRSANAIPFIAAIVFFTLMPVPSGAQTPADANCTYRQCALGIVPNVRGLAITRGTEETEIGLLSFVFPQDVTKLFSGDSEAVDAASDAQQYRTVAAALTDAGVVLMVTGIARSIFRRDVDGLSQTLTYSGLAAFGASVPLHLTADAFLSRAVWLYNRKFGR